MVRSIDEVEHWTRESVRYGVASEIAAAFFRLLDSLEPEKREKFINFLVNEELTADFEVLLPKYQHVVDYGIHTARMELFAFSSAALNDRGLGHAWLPQHALAMARDEFGVPTVDWVVHPFSQLGVYRESVRARTGCEGDVVYWINGDGAVIGLTKMKTVWYVLIRAIREKVQTMACGRRREAIVSD
eukprot:GABV01002291.1.p1 GENE.GABV01002291.1~~GABV01002291.1.p1  ORF type:complete len:187 (+),score=49.04 GABV01002291.1:1-561(+)